jgi:hypothetical protein
MMWRFSKLPIKIIRLAVISFLLAGWAANAAAEETANSGEWEKYFEVYALLPNIYITSASGTHTTLTISDILRNLDMFAFVDLGAKKDKWSFGADNIYMNLGKKITREGAVLPGELAKLDMRAFVNTTNVGYQIGGDHSNPFKLIGGVRYLYIRTSAEFDPENIGDKEILKSGHNWSGIVGFEGRKNLNEKWYLDYYADIGWGGKTDLTWQAMLGGGYQFNKWTATFAFRYLRWNFDGSGSLENLRVIGPQVGARWDF